MRKKNGAAAAVLLAVLCLQAGAGESPAPLLLLAGPPGGQWDAIGQEMERLLGREGIPVRCTTGGGVENLRRVGDGEADLGFTLYSFIGAAGSEQSGLPEINLDNAVLLTNLYPQILYIAVRWEFAEEHGLKTLRDLLRVTGPVRFSTLPRGTGSEFLFGMLLRNAYRTGYDGLAEQGWEVAFRSQAEITETFLAGQLDVCVYIAGPNFHHSADGTPRPETVFLAADEDMLDLMTHQFMTITCFIDQENGEDIPALGDYSCLVVQSAVPEETVYAVSRVLWENRDALTAVSEDMSFLSPRYATAGQGRVHPGSLRFWHSAAMREFREREEKR